MHCVIAPLCSRRVAARSGSPRMMITIAPGMVINLTIWQQGHSEMVSANWRSGPDWQACGTNRKPSSSPGSSSMDGGADDQ